MENNIAGKDTTKKTIKSISMVVVSNIFKLIAFAAIGFIVPILLNIEDYGYYKTYSLYLTYCGLFHFGFIDGIYLLYAGKDYSELNKKKFLLFTKILFLMISFVSILILLGSVIFLKDNLKIIFLLLSLNMLSYHFTSYYQFVSQITGRFKEYSTRLILLSIGNIVLLGLLYLFNIKNYQVYIIMTIVLNYLLVFWYFYTYRDITFGKSEKFVDNKQEIINIYKKGFVLLLANLVSMLILSIDKQFVNLLFDIKVFAVYSFAYSLLSMITTIISSISVVIYPFFKRNEERMLDSYRGFNQIVIMILLGSCLSFFILKELIPVILPDYIGSIEIFRIILPGLVMSSTLSIAKHNYLKVLGDNKFYFLIGALILALSIIMNFIFYYSFRTTVAISCASVISIGVWYLIVEIYFKKKYGVKILTNMVLLTLGITAFYLVSMINNSIVGFFVFLFIIAMIFALINFRIIINKIRKKGV